MGERKNEGSGEGSSGWVNTAVAAEALGVSARSVRNYILDGALVARKEKEGISERYVVSVDSLHTLRDQRKLEGNLQARRRRASRQSEATPEGTAEVVRKTAVDMLRETLTSLEMHMAQNAELWVRLELMSVRSGRNWSGSAKNVLRRKGGPGPWNRSARRRNRGSHS
jgi:hypothetical protein